MNITLDNITKKYGKRIIFENLNIQVNDNEILCVSGPSGCGKTTLLGILGLIENYDSGKITYDNVQITTKKQVRKKLANDIGFIFQNYGLIENETVYKNFEVIRNVAKMRHKDRHHVIDDALNKVGLSNIGNQLVCELSGGEQQRIAIAKAIIKKCKLILADEPTASLDEDNKKIVFSLFKNLQRDGNTVVIVSHDKEAINFADRTLYLEK